MIRKKFYDWLDDNLKEIPLDAVAVNFNLYEGENNTYDVELIGSDIFTEEDDDWVCEEIYSTEENLFTIPIHNYISDWKDGLSYIKEMIEDYMKIGTYSDDLKQLQAVGIGFVDGDIELIHLNKNKL